MKFYNFILVLWLIKVLGVVEFEGVCVLFVVVFFFVDFDWVSKCVVIFVWDGGFFGVCFVLVVVVFGVFFGFNFIFFVMFFVVNILCMILCGVVFLFIFLRF